MSRTIGRKRPQSSPVGDYQAMCGYCGVVWLRSQMWVDGQGLLVCPDEGKGIDSVNLSKMVAEDSARPKRTLRVVDGYATDHSDDPLGEVSLSSVTRSGGGIVQCTLSGSANFPGDGRIVMAGPGVTFGVCRIHWSYGGVEGFAPSAASVILGETGITANFAPVGNLPANLRFTWTGVII